MKLPLISKSKILYLSVALLLILAVNATFYRFWVQMDYIVAYEYSCNPESESCFIGCEDSDCNEKYYYAIIKKKAYDVYKSCGNDVIGCDSAYICNTSDYICEISYCESDGLSLNSCADKTTIDL